MKKNKKPATRTIILAVILGIFLLLVLAVFKQNPQDLSQKQSSKTHTSQDLKISFRYPGEWYVDDRYRSILLTNYITNLNRNDNPSSNQIEIMIDEASLCQDSIEKNLIYGGCGENQKVLNKVLNKQIQNLSAGVFSRYTVQYPDNSQKTIYYLQQGDKILQISKQPDPSQFEQEFEEIVNSIRFL